MGRVSRSHVNSLPHHQPPLLTHFLHQFQHSYLRCWHTAPAKTGVQVLSFLLQSEDFNEGDLPPLDDFEGMGFLPTFSLSQASVFIFLFYFFYGINLLVLGIGNSRYANTGQ